jgi:hypothetical protein
MYPFYQPTRNWGSQYEKQQGVGHRTMKGIPIKVGHKRTKNYIQIRYSAANRSPKRSFIASL